jgi:RNA polymerase sigma factor (sigma-70 family)
MKTTKSDLELLEQYKRYHSEEAFDLLVSRHLDLVYSAALRQVRSPQLAEEVAQSVFTDLSRSAHKLVPGTVLTSWLYQVTRRTAIDEVRRESRRQIREQIAIETADMNTNSPEWTRVEPWLDEAMETLGEPDRTAILLRYFEDKSLREVGQALGMSEDAAQKRVSRAVEQLRNFLSKHGVTVGATSLVAAVSANAVQSAPLGLSSTISAAVTLSGAATHTATIGATKTILMTTMQKTLVATALAAAVGTGLYEALEISHLRSRVESFQQQQKALKDQLDQARQERDASATSLTAAQQQNETLRREIADLPKLRNEMARLREDSRELARLEPVINFR